MSQQFFSRSQIELALSLDGFKHKQNNPNFNLRDNLEQYWSNKSWNHLSSIEARATLFLIYKAIEAWQNSPYPIPQQEFNKYCQAFHSLYEWITDPKNKKLVVNSTYYHSLKIKASNPSNSTQIPRKITVVKSSTQSP